MTNLAFKVDPEWPGSMQMPLTSLVVPNCVAFHPLIPAAAARALLHQQREVISLLEERCRAALAFVDTLEQPSTPGGITSLWLDYFNEAFDQYAAAARKLLFLELQDGMEVSGATMAGDLRDVALLAQLVA